MLHGRPATIDIAKTANPAGPVSAGDPIGFDIVVTNNGTGTALTVAVNDPLPSGIDWTLGTVTGGASCQITGPVNTEVLTCTKASLAAAASFSAHISGPTDAADCKLISNTAGVTTSNDGTDQATASVTVLCPDVTVVKTPDGGDVNAGSTATFTIVVSNLGPGIARSVTLTDQLPAGSTGARTARPAITRSATRSSLASSATWLRAQARPQRLRPHRRERLRQHPEPRHGRRLE